MRENLKDRNVRFFVQDDCLVRVVTSSDGRTYTHRCSRKAFETVAHRVAETPAEGEDTSLGDIVRAEHLPFTQANIALEFLKERGVAVRRSRRNYPASDFVFEDAMVEYHALREKGGTTD